MKILIIYFLSIFFYFLSRFISPLTFFLDGNFDEKSIGFLLGYAIFQPFSGYFINIIGDSYSLISLSLFGLLNILLGILLTFGKIGKNIIYVIRFFSGICAAGFILSFLNRLKKEHSKNFNLLSQVSIGLSFFLANIFATFSNNFLLKIIEKTFLMKAFFEKSFFETIILTNGPLFIIIGVINLLLSVLLFIFKEKEEIKIKSFSISNALKRFFTNKLMLSLVFINFFGNLAGICFEAGNFSVLFSFCIFISFLLSGFLSQRFSIDNLIITYGFGLLFSSFLYKMGFLKSFVILLGLTNSSFVNITFNKTAESFSLEEMVLACGLLNFFQILGAVFGKVLFLKSPKIFFFFGIIAFISIIPFVLVQRQKIEKK